jgi:hypothetical protein
MRALELRFRVQGLWLQVAGLGFRVLVLGFKLRFRVNGSGFRVKD